MRTLYIDCGMGAAGDMLTAALMELLPDPDVFLAQLQNIGLDHVEFVRETSTKCGITGTHITVKAHGEEEEEHSHHHHHHSTLHGIEHIVSHLSVSDGVKKNILAVYERIAQAESRVHGVPVEQVHFHEVGALDAVADITAVCLLLEKLAPEQILVSPIHVGSGTVKCAHGILPVPAPATALLLQDVPIYSTELQGELCTPTGAALLTQFATGFGNMPVMRTSAVGYGMGKKDFPRANCVRAFLGQTEDAGDTIVKLECNLDDMTPEALGFAAEQLFACGALDVYTVAIGMKKNRPGTLLCVICAPENKDVMVHQIFRHTTTLGIREQICSRYTLQRHTETADTPYGPVRYKIASGYGVTRKKAEYEDLAQIAREQNLSLADLQK